MFKFKHLGVTLLCLSPIFVYSQHNEELKYNASRAITQEGDGKLLSKKYRPHAKNTILKKEIKDMYKYLNISLDDISDNNKNNFLIPINLSKEFIINQENLNNSISDFNFPVDKFVNTLNNFKKYQFVSQYCSFFDNEPKTYKDLDNVLITYHYLNYLNNSKSDLKLNIDYFSNGQNSLIQNNYYQNSYKEYQNYDCSSDDAINVQNNIKKDLSEIIIEHERIESLLHNRSLNVKENYHPNIENLSNNFYVSKLKNEPYKYQDLINSFIAVKNCSWEVKEAAIIDKLLKDSSQAIIVFGETLFNKNWQERKSFNYIFTFQSLLINSNYKNNIDFCHNKKINLEEINLSYRKN